MTDRTVAETVPLDPRSTEALASRGLEYRTVATAGEEFDLYNATVGRGFLGERPTPEQVQGWRESFHGNRMVGVYDPRGAVPGAPVATVNSWVMDVTVDADSFLPMWSISAVTVSSTHRRRGIARALLEGELRAAADAGLPIAGLTVSEATLYGRYGFGIAARTGTWTINTRRAGWVGPRPTEGENPGRLDHIEREDIERDLAALNEATRGSRPGEIDGWPRLWTGLAGLTPGKPDPKVRGVRYTDAEGVVRGVLVYTVKENEADFPASTLDVITALADGRDAYAAIWRYAVEHDLIGTVTAGLRSLDDPLRWMIANDRALQVTERDHHWLRILDVARCLQARHFRVPGAVTFVVTDPLGIADGAWRLGVDASGTGVVEKVDGGANEGDQGRVVLGISELSSLLLGGVTASTFLAAGRIETDLETARWLDVAFTPITAPVLGYWY
ncbi:GNAT family N-acetyltransferase [Pseudactinotalea suaedae]|uniref:GNAT family N-acetyltransferase n=1 Tax=Pseudactinotalea suaedae TaxID=1524924 RepID=UPI0012E2ED48|nr:GNAT family N-acetyltransferase [Pseudactinotalea suaedae]